MDARRPRLHFLLALILAALMVGASTVISAPPAHAVPIPHPHPPLPIHPVPHPPPIEPRPPARDILPEVLPSNDPNVYDPTGIGAVPAGASRGATQAANDDDSDAGGSTSIGTVREYASDDDGGGLDLGPIGFAGGVVISVASLAMWLRRK